MTLKYSVMLFCFCLLLSTSCVETSVVNNSSKENDETLQQTITSEKIFTVDPAVSAKFQTGNVRYFL
jgi:hypothetical protein